MDVEGQVCTRKRRVGQIWGEMGALMGVRGCSAGRARRQAEGGAARVYFIVQVEVSLFVFKRGI